ncbi:MAG: methyltransferase domain-containing protein [Methanobacteriota archaeon]|nr:MAG: methyltransferase domain-containing protein [Euryarchaeota archaeon]
MKLLLELSMECEPLARSEALSVGRGIGDVAEVILEDDGVMVIDTDANPSKFVDRIALCHSVSEYLGSCNPEDVEGTASSLDVHGPIRVHSTRIGTSHIDVDLDRMNHSIGEAMGRSVDLRNPQSEVRIVYSEDVHIGRLLGSVDRASYEHRKTKNLPFDRPISIHPKFARCLVNLTETRPGERLLDPFCGTGSVVAEAALAGTVAIGADISERMIQGARANLAYLGAEAMLHKCDVGSLHAFIRHVDGIATDPPYGRSSSTNGEPVDRLFKRAFRAFGEIVDKRSRVAIAVHDSELTSLAEDFQQIVCHDFWVHRSLTRHFCVLERI